MRSLQLMFCLLFGALVLNSCKKNDAENLEEIGYGSGFGMCVGYCTSGISVSADQIIFSKSKNGDKPETKTCTKAITESEVAALKKLVNTNDFNKLKDVIGCPDCADGGSEWVTLKLEGKLRKVTFEYGNAPEALKNIVAKLREMKAEFKDCN